MHKKSLILISILTIIFLIVGMVACNDTNGTNSSDEDDANRESIGSTCKHEQYFLIEVLEDPTEQNEGSARVRCVNCDEVIEIKLPIINEANYNITCITPATCLDTGITRLELKTNPGFIFNVVSPITSHNYHKDFDQYNHWVKCPLCGDIPSQHAKKGPHDFETTILKEATCRACGYELKKCKECGYSYTKIINDYPEHDYDPITHKCKNCGILNLPLEETGLLVTVHDEESYDVIGCKETAETVTLPEYIDGKYIFSVAADAFSNLPNLKKLIITDDYRSNNGNKAIKNCPNLEEIFYTNEGSRSWQSTYENCPKLTLKFECASSKEDFQNIQNAPNIQYDQNVITTNPLFDYIERPDGIYIVRYKGGNPLIIPETIDNKKVLKIDRLSFTEQQINEITEVKIAENITDFTPSSQLVNVTSAEIPDGELVYNTYKNIDTLKLTGFEDIALQNYPGKNLIIGKHHNQIVHLQADYAESITFEDDSCLNAINCRLILGDKLTNMIIPENVFYIKDYALTGAPSTVFYTEKPFAGVDWKENYNTIVREGYDNKVPVIFDYKNNPNISTTNERSFTIDNITYLTSGSLNASVLKVPHDYEGELIIPDKVTFNNKEYLVSTIQDAAFRGCDKITSITLPKDLQYVNITAFQNTPKLTSLQKAEGTKYTTYTVENNCLISNSQNEGCLIFGLNPNEIPESVKIIGDYAFANRNLSGEYIIPAVQKINKFAFAFNEGITSIAFKGDPKLEKGILADCENIKDLTINKIEFDLHGLFAPDNYLSFDNITITKKSSFHPGKISVKNIKFEETPINFFGDEVYVEIIDIPNIAEWTGVYRTINPSGDLRYTQLSLNGQIIDDLVIPNSVTNIAQNAFNRLRFNSMYIPNSITRIDENGLSSYVNTVTIEDGFNPEIYNRYLNFYYTKKFTVPGEHYDLYANSTEKCDITLTGSAVTTYASSPNQKYGTIILSDTITSVDEQAFIYCDEIDSLTLSKNLVTFGGFNNVLMKEIEFPKTVTTIHPGALSHCPNLATITFEEGSKLEKIGDYAFSYNAALTTALLPECVKEIGYLLTQCNNLQTLNVFPNLTNPNNFYTSLDHEVTIVLEKDITYYLSKDCVVPSAPSKLVHNDIPVTKIIYPENSIAHLSLIQSCINLEEVIIPSSCTDVQYKTGRSHQMKTTKYQGPYNVMKEIASYVKHAIITKDVITQCESYHHFIDYIEILEVKDGVTKIEGYNLNESHELPLKQLILPNSIEYIGSESFKESQIEEFIAPQNLTFIGERAFSSINNLKKVVLNEGLKTIMSSAFVNNSCQEIIIPDSVEEILPNSIGSSIVKIKGSTDKPNWHESWAHGCFRIYNYETNTTTAKDGYGQNITYQKYVDPSSNIEYFYEVDSLTSPKKAFMTNYPNNDNTTVTLPNTITIGKTEYELYFDQNAFVNKVDVKELNLIDNQSVGGSLFRFNQCPIEKITKNGTPVEGNVLMAGTEILLAGKDCTIPTNATQIYSYAFSTTNITYLELPKSMKFIDSRSFANNKYIDTIVINNNEFCLSNLDTCKSNKINVIIPENNTTLNLTSKSNKAQIFLFSNNNLKVEYGNSKYLYAENIDQVTDDIKKQYNGLWKYDTDGKTPKIIWTNTNVKY